MLYLQNRFEYKWVQIETWAVNVKATQLPNLRTDCGTYRAPRLGVLLKLEKVRITCKLYKLYADENSTSVGNAIIQIELFLIPVAVLVPP